MTAAAEATAPPFWTSIGPFGPGRGIFAIAIDPSSPSTLYTGLAAGAGGGVFKSADGGATWTPARTGLPPAAAVQALVIDPSSPNTLYAGTDVAGVFRSADGGATWARANSGTADAFVVALVMSPQASSTLYAAIHPARGSGGVFKTTDGGVRWTAVNNGLPPNLLIRALAVDPCSPQTVYAGTFFGGVFKTTDGGESWSRADAGLPLDGVTALRVDPFSPSTLYAGTGRNGVFRTTDGGATWAAAGEGLGSFADVQDIAMDPTSSKTLYVTTARGVFRSADGGMTWRERNGGFPDFFIRFALRLAVAPGETAVYATLTRAGEGALFKSTDRAESWVTVGFGVGGLLVTDIALDTGPPLTIFAATATEGVLKSSDGGANWSPINNGLTSLWVETLLIEPGRKETLFAATQTGGVFKSNDGGKSWFPRNVGLDSGRITTLVQDPSSSSIYAGGPNGVFKTRDGGGEWTRVLGEQVSVLAVAADSSVYAGVYAGGLGKIFKSSDAGQSWTAVFSKTSESISALAVDPANPSIIYAGTIYTGPLPGGSPPLGGVWKSKDAGVSWTITLSSTAVSSLAVDPSRTSTIYAGTLKIHYPGTRGGLFRSVNGGTEWELLNEGLPDWTSVSAVQLVPGSALVFAATTGGSIYRAAIPAPGGSCVPGNLTLCLNGGRFRVELVWASPGRSGSGQARPLTSDTGAFWFFEPANLELVVKVLDGRRVNGRFWVVYGALTNVEYTVTVTDTETGAVKTYFNPQGRLASVADTEAF